MGELGRNNDAEPLSREKGEISPGFVFFDYLYHQYGVNVNRLLPGGEQTSDDLIVPVQIPVNRKRMFIKSGEAKSVYLGE